VFVDCATSARLTRGPDPRGLPLPAGHRSSSGSIPDSPYHKDVFDADKEFVFYCIRGLAGPPSAADGVAQQLGLQSGRRDGRRILGLEEQGLSVAERAAKKSS
jgi:hypothetical protein